jgi:hypothetical protein
MTTPCESLLTGNHGSPDIGYASRIELQKIHSLVGWAKAAETLRIWHGARSAVPTAALMVGTAPERRYAPIRMRLCPPY